MSKADLTAERLRELLHYDPSTGEFKWRVYHGARAWPGASAGGWNQTGYVLIGIDGVKYLAHRLAWLYVHGTWPPRSLKHRNFLRYDNRLENLLLAGAA